MQCKGVAELMTCHLRKSHGFLVSFKKFWGRSGFSSITAGRLVHASGYQDMHAPCTVTIRLVGVIGYIGECSACRIAGKGEWIVLS